MTFERLISLINPSLPLNKTTATEQPQAVCYVSSQEMRQNLNFPTNLIFNSKVRDVTGPLRSNDFKRFQGLIVETLNKIFTLEKDVSAL